MAIDAAGWTLMSCAIASEVTATSLLPHTHGFTRPGWSALVLSGYGLAFFFLSRTLSHVPLSVTYAIWSGVGTAVIATVGVVALGETMSVVKAAGLALVVVGVVVLNLA